MAVQKLIFLMLCLPLVISNAGMPNSDKRDDFWPMCSSRTLEDEEWQRKILPPLFNVIAATTLEGFIGQNYGLPKDGPNDKSQIVYAISRCEGDLDHALCGKCIARAASKLFQSCSGSEQARIWLDKCYLQADFIDTPRKPYRSPDNTHVSLESSSAEFQGKKRKTKIFKSQLFSLMKSVSETAAAESSRFNRLEKTVFGANFQAMAQCNRDYTQEICASCLFNAWKEMRNVCGHKTECYFKGSGCVLRLDVINSQA